MKINGTELYFDLYDADTAQRYEQALSILRSIPQPDENTRLADSIRTQCSAVFSFFDTLFGMGTSLKLFGEETNLTKCLTATEEILLEVNRQQKNMVRLIEQCRGEGFDS